MGVLSAITYAVPFFSDICSFDILFFVCLCVCGGGNGRGCLLVL